MKTLHKILLFFSLAILFGTAYAVVNIAPSTNNSQFTPQDKAEATDSIPQFDVKNNKLDTYDDLGKKPPLDLKNPDNVKDVIEYDPLSNMYFFKTKVGDMDVVTPYSMTSKEYMDYSMTQSMRSYWADKNRQEAENEKKKKFSLTDMQFNIGAADKVFGPGGVQVKMQGSAELLFGFKINKVQNPTLSERLRNPAPIFDFDEKIQLNVNGKVGDKLNFTMNYNTESSFDFDQSKIKLAYEGKEDDIIKKIEAGNVSMTLNSSLIKGSSALFGIKTDLQFGKLRVSAIASQQESETKTVSLKNGAQTTKFEIEADKYDDNRHYFLAHYFKDNFEKSMSKLPYLNSVIKINRIEVWVTNKKADFNQARNVVAFMDLGEVDPNIDNTYWTTNAEGKKIPYNRANSLYDQITKIDGVRDIQKVNSLLDGAFDSFDGGEDYEKIESARRLDPSEYTLNKELGYISLKSQLNADEVLAVAFEYTYGDKVYQVGEFSTDGIESPNALMLKMLKGTAFSPSEKNWSLMMKNVYSLGASQIQSQNFKLDVVYQNDSTGAYVNYMPEGAIKNQSLLKVFKLDRLDKRNQVRPDGIFDYIEGYTIIPSTGRIIFPVLEPFGSDLREAIGNDAIADKYVFQELYEKTKTEAQELSEKNKFKLKGEYKASVTSEIRLNAMNVPQGSVTVTAGGVKLTENVDYTVDYSMGTVTIMNQSILESGTKIDVSLESQSFFSMQRKTLTGVHLEYQFNKDFSVGGTFMHLSEKPLTNKVSFGDEPMSNTIWGVNTSYKQESQLITNIINKFPLLNATAPSSFTISGEFAQLIPGHPSVIGAEGLSYLDDFEASKTSINILYPYSWFLSSTPKTSKFPESILTNNIEYGKNRALIAWYTIDPLFTKNTETTPSHIKNDKEQLSNHYVREIQEQEIFPNREPIQGQSNTLSVLNLSYYPTQRGPYNLDATNINSDGSLKNPESRWGGIMRKMEVTDFESANIEYVEFWLMDPFIYDKTGKGGDLYFDLGEISEDVLKDGKKSFENGLAVNGDTVQTTRTVWGRIPKTQSMVNAFDNVSSSRQYQDVGLDGLRTQDETDFSTYKDFLFSYRSKLDPTKLDSIQNDAFSPLNDPAGDNYRYFRGSELDDKKMSILDRYKYYNGMEGNSPVTASTSESYTTSATNLPNLEDINQDNNLSEYEKFYEYRVSLRPSDMQIGKNYIADKIVSSVALKNGNKEDVAWYQFKIPLKEYESQNGIRDFRSIRFMRLYMTNFEKTTHLRFGTLELVRGDWRAVNKELYDPINPPSTHGSLDVAVVNIEENADKKPVNYVLPPGVTREQDPSQSQIRQQNEQSLLLKVTNLAPHDARGVYKTLSYDMRQFKKLQMFVHAEKFINDVTDLKDGYLTAFVRLGSDLVENYYEYEIPLKLTPPGIYNDKESSDREDVWPADNMFDFKLSSLSDVKAERNLKKRRGEWSYTKPYPLRDPDNSKNKITVMGNPNLGDIQTIMIGIRNQSSDVRSGEVWVNELRLSGFNEDAGYAALANTTVNLSDLGSVNVGGRIETVGFGGIEDNVTERRMDDLTQFNISTNFDLGRFFPEKAKVRIPMYYAYTKEVTKPKYDAYNQDILLSKSLEDAGTNAEKDSISDLSNTVYTTKSFNLTNVKVDLKSKTPMFYDPANFTLSYAYTESYLHNPEVERDVTKDYKASVNYLYTLSPRPWEPFRNSKFLRRPYMRLIGDFNVYYLPNSIGYSTTMMRNYNEKQLRNLNDPDISYSDPYNPLLSNSKDFMWNRKFDVKYDFSKALKFTYSNSVNARIEETRFSPVNKELFPNEYENWKDTVLRSIGEGGIPISYQQTFTGSYAIPINKIPAFSWISSNVMYTGNYTWNRGTLTAEDEEAGRKTSSMGNTITSLGTRQFDGRFSLEQLYNKSSYLKYVNQRFSSNNKKKKSDKETESQMKKTAKPFEQKIKLEAGKRIRVTHRLNAEKVKLTFLDSAGNEIKVRYTVIDNNNLELKSPENMQVTVRVETVDPSEAKGLEYAMQLSARTLMMIRNVSFNYNQSNGMSLSGFLPETGLFGQDNSAPGALFALGYQEPSFLQDAYRKGWLLNGDSTVSANKTFTSDLSIKMLVEPISGLKIDFGAQRSYATQTSIQYMYEGMPKTMTGSFSMTTIAVGTFFKDIGNSKNNYYSETYEKFKANRAKVQALLEAKYAGVRYPNKGFISESGVIDQSYNSANGGVALNSSEVLIPSFLSAYTGMDLNSDNLDLIPSLLRLLPNWRITYDGLSKISLIQEYVKSVNLTHAYTCKYSVGAFSSYANWIEVGDGLGFVPSVSTGMPIPSSQFDVPAVSLTENFNPLLRIDVTMKNNVTISTEYRKGRTLGLNIASSQLVESSNKEYVLGLGYKIVNLPTILSFGNKETKVSQDLTLRADLSIKDTKALIRKLEDDNATQATSGDQTLGIQCSAEYIFSSKLNFKMFYDRQVSTPLISSSYPTSNSNFGLSVKLLLTR